MHNFDFSEKSPDTLNHSRIAQGANLEKLHM
jgi:hypothetical protein